VDGVQLHNLTVVDVRETDAFVCRHMTCRPCSDCCVAGALKGWIRYITRHDTCYSMTLRSCFLRLEESQFAQLRPVVARAHFLLISPKKLRSHLTTSPVFVPMRLDDLSQDMGQNSCLCTRGGWLNLAVFHQVAADARYKALFQAAVLTAKEGGYTVRELAEQLGVGKSTIQRWVQGGRVLRDKQKKERIPRVETTAPPVASQECNHRRLYSDKRKRVCLRCLLSNFEGSPELKRHPNFDPVPEDAPPPTRRFKPRLKKKAK
jgi:transposase-like protein